MDGMKDMKKIKVPLLLLALLLLLIVSFFIGVNTGASQFYQREAAYRGLLLAFDLNALRQGEHEKLIELKEKTLDIEIYTALQSEKNNFPWLLFPFAHDNKRFLAYMAKYRQQYPFQALKTTKEKNSEELVIERQSARASDELVRDYGQEKSVIK
jgi:hypothetical protein